MKKALKTWFTGFVILMTLLVSASIVAGICRALIAGVIWLHTLFMENTTETTRWVLLGVLAIIVISAMIGVTSNALEAEAAAEAEKQKNRLSPLEERARRLQEQRETMDKLVKQEWGIDPSCGHTVIHERRVQNNEHIRNGDYRA